MQDAVMSHRYDHRTIGCLCLYTTPQVMLEDLMTQPIGTGDVFATANTIILMGRTRHDGRLGRAWSSPSTAAAHAATRSCPIESAKQGLVFGLNRPVEECPRRGTLNLMATTIDLSGSTALVTGSSQGIGAAIARPLHAPGARVVDQPPRLARRQDAGRRAGACRTRLIATAPAVRSSEPPT